MSTIYVATAGDDVTGNGSSAKPFQTINKASKTAAAGDTIHITAGTYHETITPQVDGLTYTGDRGPKGEWQTIIDPSTPATGWTQATEDWAAGHNVWKLNLGFQPGIFIYDGKCIECIGNKPSIDGLTTLTGVPRLKILTTNYNPHDPLDPHDPGTVKSGGTLSHDVRFWDGPYALAAYDSVTGWTYIRFRDDNISPNPPHPADPPILWAARGGLGTNWTYGIDISGISSTTISNLAVQGVYAGIRITVDKHKMGGNNNTVRNCHIQHGLHRILMQGNPAFTNPCTHDNEISFNTFTLNMYGYASPGAYPADKANATYDPALKEWFYWFLKYVVGDSSTADVAIKMGYCGANNRIHNNTFEKGAEGVFTYSCENTQIYSNTFRHLSDCGVLASDAYQINNPSTPSGETVQCNQFTDVFQFIRYDSIDVSGGVRTNFHYFLSNTGENDPNLGMIAQFHMAHSDPSPSDPFWCPSTVCRFALTMAGNRFGLTAAIFHFSGYTTTRGGIPAVTISSNSFQSPQTISWGGGNQQTFYGSNTMVGSFVNNRLLDDMGKPAWYGVGNQTI